MQIYPDGKMSQCLDKLEVGKTLAFKGPRGKFQYRPRMHKAMGVHLRTCWVLVPS